MLRHDGLAKDSKPAYVVVVAGLGDQEPPIHPVTLAYLEAKAVLETLPVDDPLTTMQRRHVASGPAYWPS